MVNALYSKKVALEILEESGALGKCVVVKKKGVFPAVARDKLMPEESRLLRWRPARVMTRTNGSPSVNDTPMLPPEFSGRELAAFMLAGAGALVADFFGDWEDGPDHASLERLDEDSGARQAVVDAFDAYREAVGKVGKRDLELDRRARESCTAYSNARSEALLQHRVSEVPQPQPGDSDTRRRELDAEYARRMGLVNADLAEQEAEMNRLQAEDKAAEQKWLHAMVAELLKPATDPAEHGAEPAPQVVPVTGLAEFEAPQVLELVPLTPRAEPEVQTAPQAVPVVHTEIVAIVTDAFSPRPLQRQQAQEQAIMRLIRDEGHDPLKLPKNKPGKPGIKAKVRKALQFDPIFTGETVFEKAWERLRNGQEIADQP